ncbi:MAG: alanine racemase [Oscillospiraceae bacterium]|jgi:alanine racemase|nr:alanine racemase [Oscillospiraceae bacterium]
MGYLRTWAEIDLDNILYNFLNIKKRAGEGVKVAAVIKADGYGHGAVPIARTLKDHADYFSVAMVEEAVALRRSGITNPILVLGYTSPALFSAVTAHDITVTIYSLAHAQDLSHHAAEEQKTVSVFLAVDTGMSRIGFADTAESVAEIRQIAALKNITIAGIFSHFAKADETDKTSALWQENRFSAFIDKIEASGVSLPFKSLYNSAGIMEFAPKFNLVRAGIVLYGLYPSDEVDRDKLDIRPVMALKTHVVHLHTVEKGVGVSYGHEYKAPGTRLIATLSAGYADGVHRLLSNCGGVLIRGKYAPITGRVCMDLFMVDVTDIPGVQLEDVAVLIGSDGGETILAEDVARHAQTINYEITCSVSKRVPRVFIKDGKEIAITSNLGTNEIG